MRDLDRCCVDSKICTYFHGSEIVIRELREVRKENNITVIRSLIVLEGKMLNSRKLNRIELVVRPARALLMVF